MKSDDIFKLKTRREIYQHIEENPGFHLREISRSLDIPYSSLKYHLNYLIKNNLIFSKMESKYLRYYVKESIGKDERNILCLLRKNLPRKILMMLLLSYATSEAEISRNLEVHPTTIEYHMKKLIKQEIVEEAPIENGLIKFKEHEIFYNRVPVKNEIIYRIKNPRSVYDALIKFKSSMKSKDEVTDFLDLFNYIIEAKRPKIIKPINEREKEIEHLFFDIFPHPYHI